MSDQEKPIQFDNIQSAFDAGRAVGEADKLVDRRLMFIHHPDDDKVRVPVALREDCDSDGNATKVVVATDVLEALDERCAGPRLRKGAIALTEVASFIAYLKRWGSSESVVYADTARLAFTAVLDDHPIGPKQNAAAWRAHRASYACPRSPEWLFWTALDGKSLSQSEFGDIIEARLEDLTAGDGYPPPLEILAMARKLLIKVKGTFQRDINPTTGDSILINKTETEQGSTIIPRAFVLLIPVFEGDTRYQVEARVRFALTESGPRFTLSLYRRKEIERDAFDAVRSKIGGDTSMLVLAGTP